jgi:hypothetical protein|tara:strand:- start:1 stop:303 length:303 start_codon:yes stop_codon:yes gene_type:complete
MKNIIVLAMLLTLSTSLSAAEKKEKWFGIGVKPDPHLVIPFVGAKVPLPSVCAGKDVSTAFNFKCTKQGITFKLPYFKLRWEFPGLSLGRGDKKVTIGKK